MRTRRRRRRSSPSSRRSPRRRDRPARDATAARSVSRRDLRSTKRSECCASAATSSVSPSSGRRSRTLGCGGARSDAVHVTDHRSFGAGDVYRAAGCEVGADRLALFATRARTATQEPPARRAARARARPRALCRDRHLERSARLAQRGWAKSSAASKRRARRSRGVSRNLTQSGWSRSRNPCNQVETWLQGGSRWSARLERPGLRRTERRPVAPGAGRSRSSSATCAPSRSTVLRARTLGEAIAPRQTATDAIVAAGSDRATSSCARPAGSTSVRGERDRPSTATSSRESAGAGRFSGKRDCTCTKSSPSRHTRTRGGTG